MTLFQWLCLTLNRLISVSDCTGQHGSVIWSDMMMSYSFVLSIPKNLCSNPLSCIVMLPVCISSGHKQQLDLKKNSQTGACTASAPSEVSGLSRPFAPVSGQPVQYECVDRGRSQRHEISNNIYVVHSSYGFRISWVSKLQHNFHFGWTVLLWFKHKWL